MNEIDVEDMILDHEHKANYNWRDWYFGTISQADIPGLGFVSIEKKETGWESGRAYLIIKVESEREPTRYFKKDFENTSFGNIDGGTFYEVRPTTRMITEFS